MIANTSMSRIFGLAAWSIICVGLGLYIGRRTREESPPKATLIKVASPEPPNHVQQIPYIQPALADRSEVSSFTSRVNALIELNRLLQAKVSVPLLTIDTVNEDFVKLYDLSPQQTQQINNLVTTTKARLAKLEATHASIEPKAVDEFTITVSPFATEGGQLYNEMLKSVRDILGAERYTLYQAMPSYDLDSTGFRNFGLADTVIELKPYHGENGLTTSSSQTTFDPNGLLTMRAKTNSEMFQHEYPELYKKMLAEGLWKYPSGKR